MPLFGKFNESAQRVITAAQKSAMQLGNHYIGSEHFLIGLVKEARREAPALPETVHETAVTEAVRKIAAQDHAASDKADFTPRVKKILETRGYYR